MIKKWELLEAKAVFGNKFLTVFEEKLRKSDGGIVNDFYSVKRMDAAFVVALTQDNQIPLVFQYKNGVKDLIWQVPAGFVDIGEEPQQTAERELAEETGFVAASYEHLGSFASNSGVSPNRDHFFLARNAQKEKEQRFDQHEEIEVKLFAFEKLVNDIKKRTSLFIDSQSQLALLLAAELLKSRLTSQ